MKLKCPLLLNMPSKKNQQKYWFFYPSEPFTFKHFNVRHPVEEEVSRERSSKPRQFKNDTHTSIIMSTLQKVTDYKRSQNTNTYLHKCISRQSVVIQGVPYARIISKTSIS